MFQADSVDYATLEGYMKALSFEARLKILHKLRLPHTLAELKVPAHRHREGEQPTRLLARQSIQDHIDRLVEVGLVIGRERSDGPGHKEYVVNGPRLYQLLEEFRQLGTIALQAPPGRDETTGLETPTGPSVPDGPHLLLVHGLFEGQAFPLHRTDLDGDRGWVVGRKPELQVHLEYDPYVSLENSEVLPGDAGESPVLTDLRGSKNGTWLNWRRLDTDERAPLRPGDVIGVGRSLLVYRDE